jgi:phosphate:Na+ symporter
LASATFTFKKAAGLTSSRGKIPSAPLYLDEAAVHMPSVALACAARETLHMGDVVEDMLRKAMTALMSNDRKLAAEVSRMDNIVDRLDEAIKLYVTKLTRESLDDRDGRRAMEIIAFAINLEHIGDIIDKNLMDLASKKIKHKYEFSKEGATELAMFHQRIIENLKLAFSVFINEDVRIARTLIEEKTQLRVAELGYAEKPFGPAARPAARKHRDEFPPSRCFARSQTYPLAHLLSRISRT